MALLRPLTSRSTYRGWAWLVLGGAVLMPYMMAGEVVAVLLWRDEAEPLLLPIQPMTFLLVLPVVAVTGLVLPVRPVLVLTARSLLGAAVPPAAGGRSWATRYRTAAWYTTHLAVGGLLSGVTLALVPFVAVTVALPFLPDPGRVSGDLLTAGWQLWWGPVAGPLALVALVYLVHLVTGGLRRLAPALLGPSTAERLAAARAQAAALAARNRLARELHDSVGHALSVVTLQAAAAGRVLDHDPRFAARALAAIEEAARRALSDLDHALGILREGGAGEDPRYPQPDLAQLPDLLATCGLQVATDLANGALDDLPGGVSREAYRIIQEGLTNALKHGAGETATLRLDRDGDGLEVTITNPVPDPGTAARGTGRGLTGMAERVTALGGSLHTGPAGGQWRVMARLPVRWSA